MTFVDSGSGGSNVIVGFGHAFAAGDVPAGVTLAGRDKDGNGVALQVDKKATYADGSLRHAVITAKLPTVAAGGRFDLDLVSAAPAASAPGLDLTTLANSGFDAEVRIKVDGTEYAASVKPLLAVATSTWLDGPLAKEALLAAPLKDSNGNVHPQLAARFQVRMDAGGSARVDVIVENDWAYAPAPSAYTYDLTITVGGKQVYSKTAQPHYAHARWRQTYYWNRAPEPFVVHDPRYLIKTGAVPNYDPAVVPSAAALEKWASLPAAPWDPMQIGLAEKYMPTTGGRPDIGLLPAWATLYLLSMDPGAARATMMTADGSGSWSIHYRDQEKGTPVSLVDYPYMTLLGNHGDTVNPKTGKSEAFPACSTCSTPYSADYAHAPSLVYLPYLLTGDHYYLEEMQFWSNFGLFQSNPGYRDHEKGLLHPDQVRGQAWGLRALGETAAFTPDADPMKQYFVDRLNDNIDYYTTHYGSGPDSNALGIITDGAYAYANNTGIAPWQDDFFTSAIGHILELGFDKAKPLIAFKSQFPIGRMSADGFCWISASMYTMIVRSSASTPVFTTFAQAYEASVDPAVRSTACESQAMADALTLTKPGEMSGYASSAEGYPANMQPALAMAAQSGAAGGAAAWAKFAARPVKPDYSNEPQFAIVPR
ncbi:hypothetical protein AKJ09_05151 [Labilithrix luteola]|uniref:Uncharacterized protein n=1 Tax=Labilithrix luteola TaxID=1391654 RepID=A0A0K1PYA3_9BACT|nr:hypothetical protein [Labilithrix luteola]AKU98487.1 hypothetical protein AKJ09_05151 [Labilithrix luteola]